MSDHYQLTNDIKTKYYFTIHKDGFSKHYYEYSNNSQQNNVHIFCFHSLFTNKQIYRKLSKFLNQLAPIIAWDMPGHGDNPHLNHTSQYSMKYHMQCFISIINKEKIRNIIYIGNSVGIIHAIISQQIIPGLCHVFFDFPYKTTKKMHNRMQITTKRLKLFKPLLIYKTILKHALPNKCEPHIQQFILLILTNTNQNKRFFPVDPKIFENYFFSSNRIEYSTYITNTGISVESLFLQITQPILYMQASKTTDIFWDDETIWPFIQAQPHITTQTYNITHWNAFDNDKVIQDTYYFIQQHLKNPNLA